MIQRDRAELAADELLAAALLGDGWEDGLQQLAEAAEAGGATLMRLRNGQPLAVLSSTSWIEADATMIAGGAPPSPRLYFPDHVFGQGFVSDVDVWPEEALRRDPYFQEFLLPRGVFYHAKARLADDDDERVSLSLKHFSCLGPYEPADIAALDCLLPKLQMAVRIARRMLDSEASGTTRVLRDRGDPVFELDAWGRVLRAHGYDDTAQPGVIVRGKRIHSTTRRAQAPLDQAIAAAVRTPQQPAIVAITSPRGERRFLYVVPVAGRARDVFLATAAVAVLIDPGRDRVGPLAGVIRQAFGLTEREAQIATLLAEGLSLPTIAERLRLGIGTIRNHVKSVFGKTGTRRQGELVALLCALRL
ncbi:MAG TPA: LuxR C-terminal-related transcriptional regulator [Stellaceae bacterium]|nr:LuxR C-terminal-related transcriptional regulator [Stellaceae bacterium]